MKIALCTIAAGKDRIYFDSAKRYLPYNKEYFANGQDVDFLLFTDRDDETIEGMESIPCFTSIWPYCTLLKNNIIGDYFDKSGRWDDYDYIFFIDADFAIGDYYNFFDHEFVFVKANWGTDLAGGFFYGGKTEYFKELYTIYKDELNAIYNGKLSVPPNLDEFYLSLFRKKHEDKVHVIDMNGNTLAFYDNENLEEKIANGSRKLLLHPYKSKGRANTTTIKHPQWEKESVINLKEGYVFVVYNHDVGQLVKLDEKHYRVLWNRYPAAREVLNIETRTIEFA